MMLRCCLDFYSWSAQTLEVSTFPLLELATQFFKESSPAFKTFVLDAPHREANPIGGWSLQNFQHCPPTISEDCTDLCIQTKQLALLQFKSNNEYPQ